MRTLWSKSKRVVSPKEDYEERNLLRPTKPTGLLAGGSCALSEGRGSDVALLGGWPVCIDDEGDVDEARPGRDIGEVREPQRIGVRGLELPIDMVQRARRRFVADRGSDRLAADHALQTKGSHQPRHGAAGNIVALSRTARARISGENLFVVLLVMAPPSQELEPPTNPARFTIWPPPRFARSHS